MTARKSAEVNQAVELVLSGECKTVYEAAKRAGVYESSVHRDPRIQQWKAKQKEDGACQHQKSTSKA